MISRLGKRAYQASSMDSTGALTVIARRWRSDGQNASAWLAASSSWMVKFAKPLARTGRDGPISSNSLGFDNKSAPYRCSSFKQQMESEWTLRRDTADIGPEMSHA